ncbi:MAG TPA: 2-oxoacid:ferredoxin oxidoreductase subunit beta [Candidatus Polarisedimenticolia bacterium]|nr:2-oxoacid:ferredoxin oxidoreductase subunit beta [Candidatus Polarisedimenticolia bacterium]
MAPQAGGVNLQEPKLTRADFATDQTVRWCPGCGDYSILAQTQKLMPTLGIPRENIVFVSGIGCSSRFPYYMNTYGFHSIHGRAPTLATGLKISRPELSIWVVTGDGDGLSIGGNHLVHAMRRNLDINILLFNNRIYGLTKGQYSPTSEFGKITKSSPFGTAEQPINPLGVALASECTFVARSLDTDTQNLTAVLERAARHKGTSFVEIYQNCNIFNDGAYEPFTAREVRSDRMVALEHGKPLIFGKERNKGIRLHGLHPEVVTLGQNGITEADLLVHDEGAQEPTLAYLLSRLTYPDYPVPVGVFYSADRPCLEDLVEKQANQATAKLGAGSLERLLKSGSTWTVT